MYQVRRVTVDKMIPVISEVLERDENVRITVTGMSMYPFLRENFDSVELSRTSFAELSRGDIVLVLVNKGQYILHRVFKIEKECFYIAGDSQDWIEGPVYPEQLVAAATVVWRKDKRIMCKSLWWRLLSGAWLLILPFRHFIIEIYSKMRRII